MTHADRIGPLEQRHFWFVARDELFLRLLQRTASPGASVLDAGCGTGRFAAALSERGFDVVATDPHLPADPPAGPRYLRSPVESLPLADGSVDVVVARDVLEHVDDAAALRELRRVVRPGGVLLVAVPGWPSLWGPRDEAAGHLRRYRRRHLVRAVTGAGFRVTEVRGYQFLLLPALVAARLVARRRGEPALRREEQLHPGLNRLLLAVNRAEVRLARVRRLAPPTGSSLVLAAVAP